MQRLHRLVAIAVFIFPAVLSAQNIHMGHTYEETEARALSVTTTFIDGSIARTERSADGELRTVLRDAAGAVQARLESNRAKSELRLRVLSEDGRRGERVFVAQFGSNLSGDWANVQLHRTWSEASGSVAAGAAATPRLVWRGDFLALDKLRISTEALTRDTAADSIASVTTDFGEVEVRSRRNSPHENEPTFTTGLFLPGGNRSLVALVWFEETQTLVWRQPDGTYGEVGPQTMPGGWTFRPNQAWANVQAFSFYRFAFEHGKMTPAAPRERSADGLSVGVNADYDGCTGLSWLDGTIYRACCDEHDRCYNKQEPNCTAWSWIWPGSWHCFMCNVRIVSCFITTFGNTKKTYGGVLGEGEECVYDWLGCPASCSNCVWQ
jgi:hypothetical protein